MPRSAAATVLLAGAGLAAHRLLDSRRRKLRPHLAHVHPGGQASRLPGIVVQAARLPAEPEACLGAQASRLPGLADAPPGGRASRLPGAVDPAGSRGPTREEILDRIHAQGFDMLSEQLQDNLDDEALLALAGRKRSSSRDALVARALHELWLMDETGADRPRQRGHSPGRPVSQGVPVARPETLPDAHACPTEAAAAALASPAHGRPILAPARLAEHPGVRKAAAQPSRPTAARPPCTPVRGRLAANLSLGVCLLLALGIWLAPFIAGASRRLAAARPGAAPVATLDGSASGLSVRAVAGGRSPIEVNSSPSALGAANPSLSTISAISGLNRASPALSVSSVADFLPTPADDDPPEPCIEYTYRPIEELREGDLVVATDPATGETRLARVTHAFQRISYHLRHLVLEDSAGNRHEIETTDEHPFYEARLRDFVPAGELRLGDAVRGPLGEILHVVATRHEEHRGGVAVYNIEVDSLHTYYIASPHARAPPALVHNARCHQHHTIPREIQNNLPAKVRNHPDVRGRKGLPNRRPVDADKHLNIVHDKTGISVKETGIRGGRYNLRFDQEIKARGGYDKVTVEQVLEIRDLLVKEFGL